MSAADLARADLSAAEADPMGAIRDHITTHAPCRWSGVDVEAQAPDPELLDTACGRCSTEDCQAVGTLSWPSDYFNGSDHVRIGLGCLKAAVVDARELRAEAGPRIAFDVPVWNLNAAVRDAQVSHRQMRYWVRQGYLRPLGDPRPGSGGEEFAFLADQVLLARQIGELARVKLLPCAAHLLLTGSYEDRAIARALVESLAAREKAVA